MFSKFKRLSEWKGSTFVLLALAGAFGFYLYASYLANVGIALSFATLAPVLALFAAIVVAFGAAMLLGTKIAPTLPCIVMALSMMGITFAARLSEYGDGAYKYLANSIVSLMAMVVITFAAPKLGPKVDVRHKHAPLVLLLLLVVIPLLVSTMHGYGGLPLWCRFGSFTVNIGTWTVLAALVVAAFDAAYDRRVDVSAPWSRLDDLLPDEVSIPMVIVVLSVCVLYASNATHLAVILLICIMAMLYVSKAPATVIAVPILTMVWLLLMRAPSFEFDLQRIRAWLNPQTDPWGRGYQTLQSLAAIKRGSILGTGVGLGTPGQVPGFQYDYIFAAVCEELGLIGGTVTVCLYVLLTVRGMRLAASTDGGVAGLLVVGLTCLTAIDALVAMGSATGLLPATSFALPYLCRGMNTLLDMGVRAGLTLGAITFVRRMEGEGSQESEPQDFQVRVQKLQWILLVGFALVALRLVTIVFL